MLSFLALTLAHPRPLPGTAEEMARQATRAALAALQTGHLRVQVTLPTGAGVDETARCLASSLEAEGSRCRLYVPRALLPLWHGAARCSSLGLGDPQQDDGAFVVLAPCNRVRSSADDEPDGHVLESLQGLLSRAHDRPVVLINADLEALVLSPRPLRPVRPMFMADFVDAFFLATAEGPTPGDTVAVRRAFPAAWEVWRCLAPHASDPRRHPSREDDSLARRRAAPWPAASNRIAMSQLCDTRPLVADVLAEGNRRAPPLPPAAAPKESRPGFGI